MKWIFFLVLAVAGTFVQAQYDELYFRDHIYTPNIRSVKFHIRNLETSMPIIQLGTPDALSLEFDDMDAVPKNFRYTVIHCNRNWVQSELWKPEYIDGFEDEEIQWLEYSVNTQQNYIHYELILPNRNFNVSKSGNYLLIVFEQDRPNQPVITRRFVVVEPIVRIDAWQVRPADVQKVNTHQEIRFEMNIDDLVPKPRNPKEDITATVLQNGRWGTALQGLVSRREMGTIYYFDWVDKITFPAGKEFRSLDIRTLQYRTADIFEFERLATHTVVIAKLDKPRSLQPFFTRIDINGNYVISTLDYGPDVNHDVRGDYVEVVFTIQTDRKYAEHVYVLGAITDWVLKDEFKMYWDEEHSAYTTSVWLKQGYYDYIYAIANSDGSPDEATIEGNWYESTNDYTILIYYREFGGRYDRIVGAYGL